MPNIGPKILPQSGPYVNKRQWDAQAKIVNTLSGISFDNTQFNTVKANGGLHVALAAMAHQAGPQGFQSHFDVTGITGTQGFQGYNIHGGRWVRHMGFQQFTIPANWGPDYASVVGLQGVQSPGFAYIYLDDAYAPTTLLSGFQVGNYPVDWDQDYKKRIVAHIDPSTGTIEQYSSGDVIEEYDRQTVNFGVYVEGVAGGNVSRVTIPGGNWNEEWDNTHYSLPVGTESIGVSTGDLVWLEVTRANLIPTSIVISNGATPPPITQRLDVVVLAKILNNRVVQVHVGDVNMFFKQDDALADSPITGYSINKSTSGNVNRDQLYNLDISSPSTAPGTNAYSTMGVNPVVGVDNTGLAPTVHYRNTDVYPGNPPDTAPYNTPTSGTGPNNPGSLTSISRSDHYHHIDVAGPQGPAGSQGGTGGMGYQGGWGYQGAAGVTTHSALSDIVAGHAADDHKPPNYGYVGLQGSASRNAMSGTIGDGGGVLSIDPSNHYLSAAGAFNSVDWMSGYLYDSSTEKSVAWLARLLVDSSGVNVLNWYGTDHVIVDISHRLEVDNLTDADGAGSGALHVAGGIDCDKKINSLTGYNQSTNVGVDIAGFASLGIVTNTAMLSLITIQTYDPITGGTVSRQVLGV